MSPNEHKKSQCFPDTGNELSWGSLLYNYNKDRTYWQPKKGKIHVTSGKSQEAKLVEERLSHQPHDMTRRGFCDLAVSCPLLHV